MAAGTSSPSPIGLLEKEVGWCVACSGIAYGPPASCRTKLQRREHFLRVFQTTRGSAESVQPAGGSHPVRHDAGGVQDVIDAVYVPRRHFSGDSNCQSQPRGDRRIDWIL